MNFQLAENEPLSDGLKRIADEQAGYALSILMDRSKDPDEIVHEVRKSFKKIRAVLKLIKFEIGSDYFNNENSSFKNFGKTLSEFRDSSVKLETIKKLTDHYVNELTCGEFDCVVDKLKNYHDDLSNKLIGDGEIFAKLASDLYYAKQNIINWPIQNPDFSLIYKGLKMIYKSGKSAMNSAYKYRTDDSFHNWRKRAKDLWYSARILTPLKPDEIGQKANVLNTLTEILGEHQDLVLLRRALLEKLTFCSNIAELQTLIELSDQRMKQLKKNVWENGEVIYSEKPKQFVNVIYKYWNEQEKKIKNTELVRI